MGAFLLEGDGSKITSAKISFGGMAATPIRLRGIEDLLSGRRVDENLIEDVGEALGGAMFPLTDVRASAEYRASMARSMLERALHEYSGASKPLVTSLNLHA
jgi:xanthine dehydrogenase small subunit